MPEPARDPQRRSDRGRRLTAVVPAVLAVVASGVVLVGLVRWHGEAPAHRAEAGGPSRTTVATGAAPAVPAEVRAPRTPGAPSEVRLPTLGVRAPVVPVRTVGRTLVPPRDPDTLGWWADGARPGGRRGSALIAGHTVHGAEKGALEDLARLRPGDPVAVVTRRQRLRYAVVRVQVLSKVSIARRAARLFSQSAPGRLVLLTCADWDGSSFRSNTVVTARPMTST